MTFRFLRQQGWFRGCLLILVIWAVGGCSTAGIQTARRQYYDGKLAEAAEVLSTSDEFRKDEVLFLMERGMVHQTRGDFAASIRDWLAAAGRIQELDYIRLSEKTASLVINDRTQTYTGRPYERVLLHAFTAKSYFAIGQWREAAVEARLIADGFENSNGFPDDAYSRYIAGLSFEMIRDFNGSRIEYLQADKLTPWLTIDSATGSIIPTNTPRSDISGEEELIVLIGIGRAPPLFKRQHADPAWGLAPYAEIFHKGRRLGRSYTLNTTGALAALTEQRLAAIQAAKTVARIVIKETIANAVAENNPLLGEVLRLLLFAFEMPDNRYWETLPYWLQVARVPRPTDIDNFDVVFRTAGGKVIHQVPVLSSSVQRSGKKMVAVLRVW